MISAKGILHSFYTSILGVSTPLIIINKITNTTKGINSTINGVKNIAMHDTILLPIRDNILSSLKYHYPKVFSVLAYYRMTAFIPELEQTVGIT